MEDAKRHKLHAYCTSWNIVVSSQDQHEKRTEFVMTFRNSRDIDSRRFLDIKRCQLNSGQVCGKRCFPRSIILVLGTAPPQAPAK